MTGWGLQVCFRGDLNGASGTCTYTRQLRSIGTESASARTSGGNDYLFDEMIRAMNDATSIAFGLMDYWTFDGWFALKTRQTQQGAPALLKTVFPGVELRLAAPMERRLNAHVLFSNETSDQHLRDFLSRLKLQLINQPLSHDALVEY